MTAPHPTSTATPSREPAAQAGDASATLKANSTVSMMVVRAEVCFAYPAPSYAREYARVFDGAARFAQSFTGMVFDRALLELPPPSRDLDLHAALRSVAERRVARVDKQVPYAVRVRELLIQRRWPKRIDMAQVARALGMSLRSLRRYLSAEGTSYSALDNEAFAIVATRLLRDERRTIQETAYEMGFSDASTFHRAFKRATGMTPSQCREQ